MISSAVSGAFNYQALGVTAKSEERRLDELQKRKYYQSPQLQGTKKATNQPQISTAGSQLKPGQSHNRSSGPSQSKQGQSAAVLTQGRRSAGIVRKSEIWRTIAPNRREHWQIKPQTKSAPRW